MQLSQGRCVVTLPKFVNISQRLSGVLIITIMLVTAALRRTIIRTRWGHDTCTVAKVLAR